MEKKLNGYEAPQIDIYVMDAQDIITASNAAPFEGLPEDLSGFLGQGELEPIH